MKRLKAKLIDFFLVVSILAIPTFSYLFAVKAIAIAYNQEVSNILYLPLIIMVTLVLFVYFGFLGKKYNGSLGKKFYRLQLSSDKNNNVFKLFIREPLVHIFYLAIIYSAILNGFMTSFIIISFIYLIALYLKVDLWNKILKIEVVEEGEK